jgi:hypothetical protein
MKEGRNKERKEGRDVLGDARLVLHEHLAEVDLR